MLNAEIYQKSPFTKYPNLSSPEELIEWALLMLSGGSSSYQYHEESANDFSLRTFDGAHLITEFLDDDSKFLVPFHEEINLKLLDINPRKLNFKVFHLPKQVEGKESNFAYLQKYSYLPFKERRGKNFKSVNVIKQRTAYLYETEKWYTQQEYAKLYSRTYLSYHKKIGEEVNKIFKSNQGKFINKETGNYFTNSELKSHIEEAVFSQIHMDSNFKFDLLHPVTGNPNHTYKNPYYMGQHMSKHFNLNISMMLTQYYNWHIYLREKDSVVGFQIPFEFNQLENIYKLREMPKTKTGRNKAIVHFVKGHYRKLKINDVQGNQIGEKETWIKKFLRGESNFKWKGIELGIIPSKYDLKRVKTSKKFADSKFNN